jgi:hypothetical protein
MDCEIPVPVAGKRLSQATMARSAKPAVQPAVSASHQAKLSLEMIAPNQNQTVDQSVLDQVNHLETRDKVALVRELITQLRTDQIEAVLEFGQREIADRQRHVTTSAATEGRTTCLLLKKDYTYQDRGLTEPMQYYVYLRRRKPKLDRYIGTLFYVPQGCTLSYFPDAEGRIFFNPPHNVFHLKDSKNPLAAQVVRLICLEPPPPEYTFTKQQDDVPLIYLRLEYLDVKTFQPLSEVFYPFPACMYEGGQLDRYRWEVSTVMLPSDLEHPVGLVDRQPADRLDLPPESQISLPPSSRMKSASVGNLHTAKPEKGTSPEKNASASSQVQTKEDAVHDGDTTKPRRILELPPSSTLFYLANPHDSAAVLERMRLWTTWSEKAMPQSRWEMVQNDTSHTLRNVNFKRKILSFSQAQFSIALENSLPVLVKWFQALSLAVSQAQSQNQYSSAQLKLARSLFVEMSLPQDDPLMMLKKLFGVKFVKTDAPAKTSL